MCFIVSDDETDTIKVLMVMSLNTIISDIFHIELDDIEIGYDLEQDLHMTTNQESLLRKSIAENFDGYELKLLSGYTIKKPTFRKVYLNFVN